MRLLGTTEEEALTKFVTIVSQNFCQLPPNPNDLNGFHKPTSGSNSFREPPCKIPWSGLTTSPLIRNPSLDKRPLRVKEKNPKQSLKYNFQDYLIHCFVGYTNLKDFSALVLDQKHTLWTIVEVLDSLFRRLSKTGLYQRVFGG